MVALKKVVTSPETSASSVDIHRLRFVPWAPSPPTALAISPNNIGSTGRGLLAIGRQNGDIDLCTWVAGAEGAADKGWIAQTTLVASGVSTRKIETLAFATTAGENYGADRLRLFSISGGSNITEHFLPLEFAASASVNPTLAHRSIAAKVPGTTRVLPSQGGVIWCMAASPLSRYIAVGCEDGHIRLVDIRQDRFEHLSLTNVDRASDGSREAVPRTDKAKSRIVSLAWGPPTLPAKAPRPAAKASRHSRADSDTDSDSDSDSSDSDEEEEEMTESFILAGTSSSVALIYTLGSGRAAQRLLLPKARSEQTIVWSALVLADGTLVTGDSLGFVIFYDAKTRIPLPDARFQVHDKGADILCLVPGTDGKTVYSGSVDQKVSEFALIHNKWTHMATRRLHAHDVKALAIDPVPSIVPGSRPKGRSVVPVLVSASTDYNVVLTPASPPSQVSLSRQTKSRRGRKTVAAFVEGLANPVSSNPITSFASTTQRRLPFVPVRCSASSWAGSGSGSVLICSKRSWIVHRSHATVEVWQLGEHISTGNAALLPPAPAGERSETSYRLLLQMEMNKRSSKLIAHAISLDGAFLAISSLSETKVYSLRVFQGELQPRRHKEFSGVFGANGAPAASAITFTPDGRMVFASWPGDIVYVVALQEDRCQILKAWSASRSISGRRAVVGRAAGATELAHEEEEGDEDEDEDEDSDTAHEEKGGSGGQRRVDSLVVSSDLQYLVCGSANHMWMYNLDTLSPHPRLLPSLRSTAVGIAPHPRHPGTAVAALRDGSVRVLQLDDGGGARQQAKWDALVAGINDKIAGVRDTPTGICWISQQGDHLLVVHGATWLLTAREKVSEADALASQDTVKPSHKRTRSRAGHVDDEIVNDTGKMSTSDEVANREEIGAQFWNVRLTFRYQPLVTVGPVDAANDDKDATRVAQALAVIERPFFELAKDLDAAWKQERRYGQ